MTCILVVDDDAWARGGVKDLLESYGYQVAEAQSGAEALEQLKTVDAAMMLSDVNMDEMSGMELVLRVRTIRPGFKFIMYTACTSTQARSRHGVRRPVSPSYQSLLTPTL
jgi:two-component system response regulator HydG